jgi:Co/Zn/Cd efflux system component
MNEKRVRAIGAHVSAALIFVASLFILHEGLDRVRYPHELHATWAIILGSIGLVINIWQAVIHVRAPKEHHNVTYSWQLLHIVSDATGSLLVVLGVGLSFVGFPEGDIVATFLIVLLIWLRVGYHVVSLFQGDSNEGGVHHHGHHHH